MIPRTFHVRRGFVHLALHVMLFALAIRLAVIQSLQQPAWAALAERMERDVVMTRAPRGNIVDRHGLGLAVTAPGLSVYVNPRAVPERERPVVARGLAKLLGLKARRIARLLERPKYFAWIKRNVPREEAEAVARLQLPGVGLREQFCRRYPNGAFLCHVLGFVGIDNEGLAGLEAHSDHLLTGTPGEREVRRDGLRRAVAMQGAATRPALSGYSLILTIDSSVQLIAEEELATVCEEHQPERACAIVMDPWNGEILAMAGWPAFELEGFRDAPAQTRSNMAVMECLEPGSTFKPFLVSAALEYGLVTPETVFNCHQGSWPMGGRVLHDAHPYGRLTVRDIIVRSSNIGVAQVAARLGPERMYGVLRAFGFGDRSRIELPGESAGILRPPREWSHMSVASIAMGQEVAVTPLQLVAGFCTFANGGWQVNPRILLGIGDTAGRPIMSLPDRRAPRRVLSERVARLMREDLLAGVVERGTARRAAIRGCRMAGKTGTAQIARADGLGYESGAYTATFVGIVPADAPQFVIGLVVKRPSGKSHYGGTVAAPAVARMAERILGSRRVPPRVAQVGHADIAARTVNDWSRDQQ